MAKSIVGSAIVSSSLIAQSSSTHTSAPTAATGKTVIGMVLFEGFECLDVFGPIEMFGMVKEKFSIVMLAEKAGPVRSAQGPVVIADRSLADAGKIDLLIVPGGMGTRREVDNAAMLQTLKQLGEATPKVATVCTGSGLLAKTGLLNGIRATSNKRAFKWATSQGPAVKWVAQARWVEDGKFFSSSGVSAGMDMALGIIENYVDRETAEKVAVGAEYEWHSDKNLDPFAKRYGLTD